MKKILLASVALTAFAGAAAAEVSFKGDAQLGYNDDVENGFYWDAGLTIAMSQELDNGLTVAASLDVDLDNGTTLALGDVATSDFVVTVSSDVASLTFGDVLTAASTFAFVSEGDGSINDETSDYTAADLGIMGKVSFGDVTITASEIVSGDVEGGVQVAVAGSAGGFNYGVLYQEENLAGSAFATQSEATAEAFLVSFGGTFGGVDVTVNAGEVANESRFGIDMSYAMGDVTLGAFYLSDDAIAEDPMGVSVAYASGPLSATAYYKDNLGGVNGADEYSVAFAYDMGNGLVLNAGTISGDVATDDAFNYFVADYALGGGASFLVSYADANENATLGTGQTAFDDIDTTLGGYELMSGLTAELKFAF